MLHICKKNNCDCLDAYKKNHKYHIYGDLHDFSNDSETLKQEKIYTYQNLKNDLYNEQFGLCCYCCDKINDRTSTIEHIVPQCIDVNKSMEYNNLLLSCRNINTCNHKKASTYDKNYFISPLEETCENYFTFNIYTGEILSSGVNDLKANYTIEVLNLNSFDLKEKRKSVIKKIKQRQDYNQEAKELIFKNYVMCRRQLSDIVKYYLLNVCQ